MTIEYLIELLQRLMITSAIVGGPVLLSGMVVGLLVSIFQSATQLQEQSLTFVPKVVATGIVLVIAGPMGLDRLIGFTTSLIREMALLAPGAGG